MVLITAIENELVEAKRVLASRGAMPTHASDAMPTANRAPMAQSPAPTDAPKTAKWLVNAVSVALFILGVAIALATNVASTTIPEEWKPYSWLSVGILVLVLGLLLLWQAKQTQMHST